MIDLHVEFYDKDLKKMLKKLGFSNACVIGKKHKGFISGVRVGGKLSLSKLRMLEKDNILFLSEYNKKAILHAIKNSMVDVILDLDQNMKSISLGLLKLAGEKKIGICFDFRKILETKGYVRSGILKNMRTLVKMCIRKKVPTILASGAQSLWELRSSSDLIAFGELIGMNRGQAKKSLDYYPNKYINKEAIIEEI